MVVSCIILWSLEMNGSQSLDVCRVSHDRERGGWGWKRERERGRESWIEGEKNREKRIIICKRK